MYTFARATACGSKKRRPPPKVLLDQLGQLGGPLQEDYGSVPTAGGDGGTGTAHDATMTIVSEILCVVPRNSGSVSIVCAIYTKPQKRSENNAQIRQRIPRDRVV